MSGLRQRPRDAALLERTRDAQLAPPAPAELVALVSEHLSTDRGPRARDAQWTYARWKPGVSLTAGYSVEMEDHSRAWVTWKRYADGKHEHLSQRELALRDDSQAGALLPCALIAQQCAILWTPPFDRELPGLERALDLSRCKRMLASRELFPGHRLGAHSSRAHLARYKPERRAVIEYELRLRPDSGGKRVRQRLFARVHPPERAERVLSARAALGALAPRSLLPELLASEPRTGILFEQALEVEACASASFEHAREAGRLLGLLHGLPIVPAPRAEGRSNEDQAVLFGLDERLARAAMQVTPGEDQGGLCWVHGDVHADQFARERTGGRLRLLDWDAAGLGRAAGDLASWIADHVAEGATPAAAAGELLAGYREAGGKPPAESALSRAVSRELVALAAAGLRRLERGSIERAQKLLELAREAGQGALHK